jgi:dipeptidyl aminopeptidase/acylaminoacyl peptidase
MLLRAARIGGDTVSVPAFLVQGGQTVSLVIIRQGADTMLLNLGGALARLRVDSAHRILGGEVPSQNLRIVRQAGAAALLREPPPDYAAPRGAPYTATEVVIPTPMGHNLVGTLTLPSGAGPGRRVPAVITSTGSGPQERDQAIPGVSGYRPFRQLADTLARHGIAVLRMDDRGHGGSGGAWAGATTTDFAEDIRAGLAWLRARPEIDASRLAIVGHSEGGLVAPMVAATDPALRAIVLLAAPSHTGRRVIRYQQRQAIDAAPGLDARQRDSTFAAAQEALDSVARLEPWLRYYLEYDPLPGARTIQRPAVLIIQGATDRQVTADQAPEWEAAFRSAGNADVTMRVFDKANHLLIEDPDGSPANYSQLPHRAIRADILGTVLDWLRRRLDA